MDEKLTPKYAAKIGQVSWTLMEIQEFLFKASDYAESEYQFKGVPQDFRTGAYCLFHMLLSETMFPGSTDNKVRANKEHLARKVVKKK